MLDDVEVARDRNFGEFKSYNVTNCEVTPPPSVSPTVTQSPPSLSPSKQPFAYPSSRASSMPSSNPSWSPTDHPTAHPSKYTTLFPSMSPTLTQSPTPISSKKCEDGSDLVRIEVTLGEQPCDSYWDLRDQRDDKKIIVDVRYDVKAQTIVREVCKPREDCYLFTISTTDASALVFLNEIEIAKATTECEIKIGDSCC